MSSLYKFHCGRTPQITRGGGQVAMRIGSTRVIITYLSYAGNSYSFFKTQFRCHLLHEAFLDIYVTSAACLPHGTQCVPSQALFLCFLPPLHCELLEAKDYLFWRSLVLSILRVVVAQENFFC